jgi:hypothetical protein
MCPRPTKPIRVDVVVAISRPPFDRRNVILAELEVRWGEDRVDLIGAPEADGSSFSIEFAAAPADEASAASATPARERRPELMPRRRGRCTARALTHRLQAT